MKQVVKEKIFNYIMLFGILAFLLAGSFIIYDYFNKRNNECIENPLIFGAKELTDTYGHEFFGFGLFNNVTNSPVINFNSTSMQVVNTNPR